jgi:hypothetical protein
VTTFQPYRFYSCNTECWDDLWMINLKEFGRKHSCCILRYCHKICMTEFRVNTKYLSHNSRDLKPITKQSETAIEAVTKLHASRPQKDFTPPYRAALSHQYSVARFATTRVLSCLHSPELRCLCCKDVRFFCDIEAWNLETAAIITRLRFFV